MGGQPLILYFGVKNEVPCVSQSLKDVFFFPPSIFLMIWKHIFNFEQHQSLPDICMDTFAYEKVGVIKHIKAQALVKVELTGLWKNRTLDDVEWENYFVTNCNNNI